MQTVPAPRVATVRKTAKGQVVTKISKCNNRNPIKFFPFHQGGRRIEEGRDRLLLPLPVQLELRGGREAGGGRARTVGGGGGRRGVHHGVRRAGLAVEGRARRIPAQPRGRERSYTLTN